MRIKRLLSQLCVIALCLSTLAACSNPPADGDTAGATVPESDAAGTAETSTPEPGDGESAQPIQIITAADELPIVEYAAQLYQDQYGAEVEIVSQSYDQTYTKIMTSIMGGAPVDIVSCDSIWVKEFAEAGVLIPLNDYFPAELRSDVLPAFLETMSADGNIMGVPFTAQAKWLFYNEAMLREAGYDAPPATWDELFEMGREMQKQGLCKYAIAWAATQAEGLVCDWCVALISSGSQWRNDAGEWAFDDENGVRGLSLIVDSIANGDADPASVSYTDRDNLNPFMAGDTPFVLNWNFAYALSNSDTESKIAGDVGIALIPGNAPGITSASVTGGGSFGIASTSKNPDSAWKYLALIVGREAQEYGITEFSNMPMLASMYADDALMSQYPHMREMYAQFEYAVPRPALSNYSEWSSVMQVKLHEAVSGNKTVEEALAEMKAESDTSFGEP